MFAYGLHVLQLGRQHVQLFFVLLLTNLLMLFRFLLLTIVSID